MRAGELRERVAFERRLPQADGYGNTEAADFTAEFTVAAKIQPRFGGEEVMAARLAGRQPVTITVRQSSQTRQITEAWRARDARTGEIYNVRSIADPDGRGARLDILCEKGVST